VSLLSIGMSTAKRMGMRLMPEILTCQDFPGGCCDSCHDDADEGWGELMEIVDKTQGKPFERPVLARVCCRKIEAAREYIEGQQA
jgi:hypothetical protein